MTPERFQEVARLVGEALDLAPDDRAAFLAEACAGDPALRAEVESLLASSLAPGGWLDRDLLDWAAPLLQADPPEGLGGRRRGAGFLEGDALAGAAPLLEGETVAARGGAGRIGPYRLERLLGAGGMGEVWLAHDQRLDRSVALKLLDPDLAADPSSRRRFLREARLASALDHPHVCTIHEVGEADGVAFIAMQYLEGATIKELLADGPLPVSQWVPLALQVGEALAAAHARGIVHRDVKSSNVAVTTGGQAKVLDFGIAKRLADADAAEATQLTAVGSVLGTPGSMSPEQASGEAVDHRSDVFSLGVVMYEMATGDSPFVGFSRTEVLRAVVAHPHTPACERNPAVPAPLSRVIDRALAKTPGERYGAMRELLDDLRRAAGAAETDRGLEQRQRRRARIGIALAVALVVALSITSWLLRERGAAPPAIRSLAVLPFKPLVPQQSDEALELGMADTLIARLESLPELRVRPIGAVRRYAGQELDPVEVGRAQRTDAVLDGHIQKTSDAVRVTVRLVRVADGEALWSDRFDVPLADLFAVQDSISERVATALARRLSSEQRARLIQHSTDDPEAYRLYLLGRYHLTRMTDDGIWKGMTYFQQAVDKDPDFAQAFAGLADAWLSLGVFNVQSPKQVFPQSRRAAQQALRLDERLAGPHVALGSVLFNYDWEWAPAEVELRRGLELEPDSAEAHHMYAYLLAARRRFTEAERHMRRARELDPLSLPYITGLGEVFYLARRFAAAEAQHRQALEMDPNLGFAYWGLGRALSAQARHDEAIAALRRSIPLSGDSPDEPAELARAYALAGRAEEARAILVRLEHDATRRYMSPAVLAAIHGALGERDQAFALLERAFAERDFVLVLLGTEPMYDPLRTDPRFAELVRRVDRTAAEPPRPTSS